MGGYEGYGDYGDYEDYGDYDPDNHRGWRIMKVMAATHINGQKLNFSNLSIPARCV